MHRFPLAALMLVAISIAGCAAAPPPLVVRAGDLDRMSALAPGQPLVIELQAGDEIPLDVSIEGALVRSETPPQPIKLKVARHFFMRIDEDGVTTSLDGKTFGDHAAPGAFRFGVGATKDRGLVASMAIRTPTPREPGG